MRIDIVTIFPEMCLGPLQQSILGRGLESKLWELHVHDLRKWATDKWKRVDDIPYGGGQGMVMKPEPFFACIAELRQPDSHVILLTPQGTVFHQAKAAAFAQRSHLILLCGHYEGIDHRVIEACVDEEISIGDYVLTNGAIAANILVDATVRLLPGVLGDERSAVEESFSNPQLLEAPVYTRPPEYAGRRIPEILVSGNHAKIAAWKKAEALRRTTENRPDLLGK
jgi:tRNA (guanine37-N1)-methyltransferase